MVKDQECCTTKYVKVFHKNFFFKNVKAEKKNKKRHFHKRKVINGVGEITMKIIFYYNKIVNFNRTISE